MEEYSLVEQSEVELDHHDYEQGSDGAVVKSHREEEEEDDKASGGVINTLISNLVSPLREGNKEEEEERRVKDEVHGGGGAVNSFISNLFHQSDQHQEHELVADDHQCKSKGVHDGGKGEIDDHMVRRGVDDVEQVKKVEGEDGGGGIINNFISNFFNQNEAEAHEKEEGKGENVGAEEEEKEETKEGGGGIINNLVSNLPAMSIPGKNLAPATDEATILIHSIIHD